MRVLKLHWDPTTQTSDHFALGTTKIFLQRRVWEACTRRQQELLHPAHISAISRLYLACISPIYRRYLAHISP